MFLYLAALEYRHTNAVKPTNLYLSYNYHRLYALVLFFRNVFHHHKKSFLFIEVEVHRCIT